MPIIFAMIGTPLAHFAGGAVLAACLASRGKKAGPGQRMKGSANPLGAICSQRVIHVLQSFFG